MPRRRDERARVNGPIWCATKNYWRVIIISPGATDPKKRRVTRYYRDESEADEDAEAARRLIEQHDNRSVGEAITAYEHQLQQSGTSAYSYRETVRRLRVFFPDHKLPISRITPERAKSYYENFRQRRRPDGDTISVDYHRSALINARSLCTWCIGEGWLEQNPFAGVKGIGRRNAGKAQHTGDEVRKLYAHCLGLAEQGDRAALGVLMALLMALRSGDLTRRLVRDVDLDGTVLQVWKGKTKKSNRPRRIPEVLQPMLRQLAKGRSPFEPLFKTPYTKDGHHTRRWLEEAMVRFCEAASVPYVCPHALKGAAGTILAETGAAADVIADHLSHEETATSSRHYIAPGVLEQAQQTRALKVIAGGKGG